MFKDQMQQDVIMVLKFPSNSPVTHVAANTLPHLSIPAAVTVTCSRLFAVNRWHNTVGECMCVCVCVSGTVSCSEQSWIDKSSKWHQMACKISRHTCFQIHAKKYLYNRIFNHCVHVDFGFPWGFLKDFGWNENIFSSYAIKPAVLPFWYWQ